MRIPRLALVAGVAVVAAACSDATAPRAPEAATAGVVAQSGGTDKITVCHAAGQAGTTHFIAITVSVQASYGHIDENGTPQAGHEQDYIVTAQKPCPPGDIVFTKTLVNVYSTSFPGGMGVDPNWTPGGVITIPQGETRWLEYIIHYELPAGVTATITDIEAAVCAPVIAAGYGCGFNGPFDPGVVSGSGDIQLIIDIWNINACGDTPFTNTATLDPSVGPNVVATATVILRAPCATLLTAAARTTHFAGTAS